MRATLVVLHCCAGLVLAGFLLVAGLAGSLLAWNDELEAAIYPALFLAAAPSQTSEARMGRISALLRRSQPSEAGLPGSVTGAASPR